VRPGLAGRFPSLNRSYELGASGLQTPAGCFDVVDLEPCDGARVEVDVVLVRGTEDLDLAAVRQLEDHEVFFFVVNLQSHGLPIEGREIRESSVLTPSQLRRLIIAATFPQLKPEPAFTTRQTAAVPIQGVAISITSPPTQLMRKVG
jgi:hypothetical protein